MWVWLQTQRGWVFFIYKSFFSLKGALQQQACQKQLLKGTYNLKKLLHIKETHPLYFCSQTRSFKFRQEYANFSVKQSLYGITLNICIPNTNIKVHHLCMKCSEAALVDRVFMAVLHAVTNNSHVLLYNLFLCYNADLPLANCLLGLADAHRHPS